MVNFLLLIRHTESTKNKKRQLASSESQEMLTSKGVIQASVLAEQIALFIDAKGLFVQQVYCANSRRAIDTGRIIASKLNLDVNVVVCNEFLSFNVGTFAGSSEKRISKVNPIFTDNLRLYRKGVVNSYDIIYGGTKQLLQDYEESIKTRLNLIIKQNNKTNFKTCVIVVMHRSALTATFLDIAREFYSYPNEFYGYIGMNIGTLSLISIDENNTKRFELLCENPKKLLKIYDD